MTVLLVAVGAALGAPLRFLAGRAWDHDWPVGTWLVNVVGSGALGVFLALSLNGQWWAFLATGWCGAITSYSTFAVQSVELPAPGSAGYVAATVVGSLAACGVGFALAGGW